MNGWVIAALVVLGATTFYLLGYYMAKDYWHERGFNEAQRHYDAVMKRQTHETWEWKQ